MEKIEYFVKCINDDNLQLWRHRYFKQQFAPLWEKLNPKEDNIEEIIRTHKYKYDTYPDNDCFHTIIEYTVEIKKNNNNYRIYLKNYYLKLWEKEKVHWLFVREQL